MQELIVYDLYIETICRNNNYQLRLGSATSAVEKNKTYETSIAITSKFQITANDHPMPNDPLNYQIEVVLIGDSNNCLGVIKFDMRKENIISIDHQHMYKKYFEDKQGWISYKFLKKYAVQITPEAYKTRIHQKELLLKGKTCTPILHEKEQVKKGLPDLQLAEQLSELKKIIQEKNQIIKELETNAKSLIRQLQAEKKKYFQAKTTTSQMQLNVKVTSANTKEIENEKRLMEKLQQQIEQLEIKNEAFKKENLKLKRQNAELKVRRSSTYEEQSDNLDSQIYFNDKQVDQNTVQHQQKASIEPEFQLKKSMTQNYLTANNLNNKSSLKDIQLGKQYLQQSKPNIKSQPQKLDDVAPANKLSVHQSINYQLPIYQNSFSKEKQIQLTNHLLKSQENLKAKAKEIEMFKQEIKKCKKIIDNLHIKIQDLTSENNESKNEFSRLLSKKALEMVPKGKGGESEAGGIIRELAKLNKEIVNCKQILDDQMKALKKESQKITKRYDELNLKQKQAIVTIEQLNNQIKLVENSQKAALLRSKDHEKNDLLIKHLYEVIQKLKLQLNEEYKKVERIQTTNNQVEEKNKKSAQNNEILQKYNLEIKKLREEKIIDNFQREQRQLQKENLPIIKDFYNNFEGQVLKLKKELYQLKLKTNLAIKVQHYELQRSAQEIAMDKKLIQISNRIKFVANEFYGVEIKTIKLQLDSLQFVNSKLIKRQEEIIAEEQLSEAERKQKLSERIKQIAKNEIVLTEKLLAKLRRAEIKISPTYPSFDEEFQEYSSKLRSLEFQIEDIYNATVWIMIQSQGDKKTRQNQKMEGFQGQLKSMLENHLKKSNGPKITEKGKSSLKRSNSILGDMNDMKISVHMQVLKESMVDLHQSIGISNEFNQQRKTILMDMKMSRQNYLKFFQDIKINNALLIKEKSEWQYKQVQQRLQTDKLIKKHEEKVKEFEKICKKLSQENQKMKQLLEDKTISILNKELEPLKLKYEEQKVVLQTISLEYEKTVAELEESEQKRVKFEEQCHILRIGCQSYEESERLFKQEIQKIKKNSQQNIDELNSLMEDRSQYFMRFQKLKDQQIEKLQSLTESIENKLENQIREHLEDEQLVNDLERRMKILATQIDHLEEEKFLLQENMKAEVLQYQEFMDKLETQNYNLRNNLVELTQNYEKLDLKYKELSIEKQSFERQNRILKGTSSEVYEKEAKMLKGKKQYEAELKERDKSIIKWERQFKRIENQISYINRQNSKLKLENDHLKNQANNFDNKLFLQEREILKIDKERSLDQITSQKFKAQFQESNSTINKLNKKIKDLEDQIEATKFNPFKNKQLNLSNRSPMSSKSKMSPVSEMKSPKKKFPSIVNSQRLQVISKNDSKQRKSLKFNNNLNAKLTPSPSFMSRRNKSSTSISGNSNIVANKQVVQSHLNIPIKSSITLYDTHSWEAINIDKERQDCLHSDAIEEENSQEEDSKSMHEGIVDDPRSDVDIQELAENYEGCSHEQLFQSIVRLKMQIHEFKHEKRHSLQEVELKIDVEEHNKMVGGFQRQLYQAKSQINLLLQEKQGILKQLSDEKNTKASLQQILEQKQYNIETLIEEIQNIHNLNQDLERLNQGLEQKNLQFLQLIQQSKLQIQSWQEKCSFFEQENQRKDQIVANLSQREIHSTQKIITFSSEYQHKSDQLHSHEKEVQRLTEKVKQLKSQYIKYDQTAEFQKLELQKYIEALKEKYQEKCNELKILTERYSDLKQKKQEVNKQLQEKEKAIELKDEAKYQTKLKYQQLVREFKLSEQKKKQMKSTLKSLEQENSTLVESLKEFMRKHNLELEKINNKSKYQDEEIISLKEKVQDKNDIIIQLKQQITNINAECVSLKEKNHHHVTQFQKLEDLFKSTMSQYNHQLSGKKNIEDDVKSRLVQFERQIAVSHKQSELQQGQIKEKNRQIIELRESYDDLKNKFDRLRIKSSQQFSELVTKYEITKQENQIIKARYEKIQTSYQQQQNSIKLMERQFHQKSKAFQNELQEARHQKALQNQTQQFSKISKITNNTQIVKVNKKCTQLEETVKVLENSNKKLTQELQNLRQLSADPKQIKTLIKSASENQIKMNLFGSELKRSKQMMDEAERENDKLRQEVKQCSQKCKDILKLNQILESEIIGLTDENKDLEKQIRYLRQNRMDSFSKLSTQTTLKW